MTKSPDVKKPKTAWCPNCGIPKSAEILLEKLLKKKKKLIFKCSSCGFVCIIMHPDLIKEFKGKGDDDTIDVKELVVGIKDMKTVAGALKGFL